MSQFQTYESKTLSQRVSQVPSNNIVQVDYVVRTDKQPVYLGFAPKGTADSAAIWILHYYTYDGSDRFLKRTIAYDSWDNRATTASYS